MSESSRKKREAAQIDAMKKGGLFLACIVIAVLAVWGAAKYMTAQSESIAPPAAKSFFYDTESGALFVAPATRALPVAVPGAPEGAKPSGVIALVFSCGKCDDEKSREPYLLETKDPNDPKGVGTVVAAIRKAKTPVSELTWIPANAPAAIEADAAGLAGRCPGKSKPILCTP